MHRKEDEKFVPVNFQNIINNCVNLGYIVPGHNGVSNGKFAIHTFVMANLNNEYFLVAIMQIPQKKNIEVFVCSDYLMKLGRLSLIKTLKIH